MLKSNADYVIQKLKKINFPLPRKRMTVGQIKEIENQLDEIEQSIIVFRKHLKGFNPIQQ